MIRPVLTKAPRLSPVHDRIATAYFNKGITPEEAIKLLASANYVVSNTVVDGITVANILRGMYLLKQQEAKPAPKRRAKAKA